MKKAKIILTAIAVFVTVGGALAFKAHKAFDGAYLCQINSGTCLNTTKYKIVGMTEPGTNLYCNNGTDSGPGSTNCNNRLKVVADLR